MAGGRRPGAGRRKGSYELATRIREAVREAIELGEKKGNKSLRVLLFEAMQNTPMRFMQVVTPLLPKEIDLSNRNQLDGLTDEELAEVIARLKSIGAISPTGAERTGEEGRAEEPGQLH